MRFRHFAISLVAGMLLLQPASCTKCSKSETTSQESAAVSQAKSSKQKKSKRRKRQRSMGTRTVKVDGQKRRYSVQDPGRSKSNKSNKAPVHSLKSGSLPDFNFNFCKTLSASFSFDIIIGTS